MRLYIKGDFTKEIPFDYLELAKRMWFENYQGEGIPLSYSGFLQIRDRNDIAIHLKLDKQDYDERWLHVPIQEGIKYRFFSQIDEELNLDYEDAYVTDFRENGDCLRLASTHLELLTLDKRAFYIMALEIATIFNGQISEDDKKTWLTIEEFKEKHEDILSLTFEEANEMSLEEIQTIDAIDDPIWEGLDRKREEYIKIHGERVYDDEDDE
ncbi:hypothetical protein [Streptococcus gordonii]|uniref:Uncharacterized protein n=1 Tax=Streptococcus gordonii (strain Challis / ATCC 35105 / BCRC 15272 / CH1 / DL1 / V288) TaxID=467705 RepID=A8AZ37_STRGC|nr:hypothetical protein [Streptococcus gordonii]ABV09627.1 conserved hypothetical protein [Streptococcus gordonii str. Challis substr. CH1]MBZ2137735.1 hypothetical protein [Streptococcus gordonii]QGS44083.1 hypothetical protein FOB91_04905 [Streptococcus gordonii]RSJ43506.1 hypothetical protein D8819_02510 [Streptococcus gordonii]VEE22702.1 Uncharacterised protein [Streptococcus gordonii]